MKETVLLINITDKQRLRKMKMALLPLKVRMRQVSQEEYLQPVGYLAGNKDVLSGQNNDSGEALEKEMVVFAAIGDNLLDRILAAMRKAGVQVDYKAVLTEHNQTWDCIQLYQELQREHQSFQK